VDIIKKFQPLFGEWYAESLIGTGSFGRVYKTKREDFDTTYYSALKYISLPQSEAESSQLRQMGMNDASISEYYGQMARDLSAEIQLMYKLRGNTNIVAYEDHKRLPKPNGMGYDIFIRMELLTPLDAYAADCSLSQQEVVRLGLDICNALELCRRHHIIHRDIKPENIFVSQNGDFKLGDFGVARQLERTGTNLTKIGTKNYMAPEIFAGSHYDATVDIYSLGIVMYRLLNNNRIPFVPQGQVMPSDWDQALLRRMRGDALPLPANAQNRLGEIVLKACASGPRDRYQTPQEMREELFALADGTAAVKAAPCVVSTVPAEMERANDMRGAPAPSAAQSATDRTASLFGVATPPSAAQETTDTTVSLFDMPSIPPEPIPQSTSFVQSERIAEIRSVVEEPAPRRREVAPTDDRTIGLFEANVPGTLDEDAAYEDKDDRTIGLFGKAVGAAPPPALAPVAAASLITPINTAPPAEKRKSRKRWLWLIAPAALLTLLALAFLGFNLSSFVSQVAIKPTVAPTLKPTAPTSKATATPKASPSQIIIPSLVVDVPSGMFFVCAQVPEDWGTPNIWAWSDQGKGNVFDEWPGECMSAVSDYEGWYYYSLPNWVNGIVLSADGGAAQTIDIKFLRCDELYISVSSEVEDGKHLTSAIGRSYEIIVHVKVPKDWKNAYIWAWSADYQNAFEAWPGMAMKKESGDWYSFTIQGTTNNILISYENYGQTENIIVEAGEVWVKIYDDYEETTNAFLDPIHLYASEVFYKNPD